jgi:hypothetical protein
MGLDDIIGGNRNLYQHIEKLPSRTRKGITLGNKLLQRKVLQ